MQKSITSSCKKRNGNTVCIVAICTRLLPRFLFSRTHRAQRSSALRFSPTHRAPLAPASDLATAYLTSLHVLRRVSKATRAKNTLQADHHAALVVRTEQLLSLSQYTPALRFSVFGLTALLAHLHLPSPPHRRGLCASYAVLLTPNAAKYTECYSPYRTRYALPTARALIYRPLTASCQAPEATRRTTTIMEGTDNEEEGRGSGSENAQGAISLLLAGEESSADNESHLQVPLLLNDNPWLPNFDNGIAVAPNERDRVYTFLSSSRVPDLRALAKLFKLGTVGNKRNLICKVLMFLYKVERNGGQNWPAVVAAKYVDWIKSPPQLNKVFYMCPEERQITSGQPESLGRRTSERSGSGLDVSISSDPRFTLDEFARLCAILFRNEEARAALLKTGEDLTRAELDRRESRDMLNQFLMMLL